MAESQGLKVEQFPIDLLYFCRDCPPSDFPQTNMSMETVQWFISILFGVSGKISPNISFAGWERWYGFQIICSWSKNPHQTATIYIDYFAWSLKKLSRHFEICLAESHLGNWWRISQNLVPFPQN